MNNIEEKLAGFTGTTAYHRVSPLHGKLVLTDGAKALADLAGAYWLFDLIASYQPKCMKDKMLREMQFWTVKVAEDKSAMVTCDRDTGDEFLHQKLEFTDFPLKEAKVWVEPDGNGQLVAMLPSEH